MNHEFTHTPDYLRLCAGGAKFRMLRLRDKALQTQGDPPSRRHPSWREARQWGFHNWQSAYATLSQGLNGADSVWYTHVGEEFRNERDSYEIVSDRCLGWFTSPDYYEKAIGIVAMLPHGRYIAGYRWTANGERVYFDQVFTDETDAARMADEHARVFAESQFEHEIEDSEVD